MMFDKVFGKPFPHYFADNFFGVDTLRAVVKQWPRSSDPVWKQYETGKRACHDYNRMPTITQVVVARGIQGGYFQEMLSEKLGIPNLIADDTLHGAGLHETLRGGRLGMHVDFNIHPVTKLYRRVNAILYLNETWAEEDGGALILSNGNPDEDKMISPRLGTFVAWETADDRWHGHPDPLQSESRKSIAWYFYTAEQPPGFSKWHGTIYR